MTHKGRFTPTNRKKYRGDIHKITYRSSWERKFMVYCDTQPSIVEWGSEELVVPYTSPLDGRRHRYFPDFYVKTKNGDNFMIEIKPSKYTKPPKKPKRVTKGFIYESKEWAKNVAKWDAAKRVCKRHGWKFQIYTEHELKLPKY